MLRKFRQKSYLHGIRINLIEKIIENQLKTENNIKKQT